MIFFALLTFFQDLSVLLNYFSLRFRIYICIQILSNAMKEQFRMRTDAIVQRDIAQPLRSLMLHRLGMQWPVNKKPSQNMCVSGTVRKSYSLSAMRPLLRFANL